jgi:ABC-type transport system involved in multi-copper enzyme maturation permease subunit
MTTIITFLAADEMGGGPGFGVQTDLTSAQGLVAGLATAANLFGVIVLALWAAATASDYSTGWIRVLVQAEPRRWRLFGGKLLALTGYTVVGTAVATLISVAVAPYLAGAAGVSTVAWSAGAIGTVLSAWVNLTFSVLVWGVIGVAVATVTRSVTAAIAGGIGYMMVVEGLLGMVLDTSVTAYLPGSVLIAVTSGGNADLAFASAVVLGLAYAVTATVIAGVTFWRRDITS